MGGHPTVSQDAIDTACTNVRKRSDILSYVVEYAVLVSSVRSPQIEDINKVVSNMRGSLKSS